MSTPIANPTRTRNVPWREIDGRAVVIHPKRGEVHELNPVATYLWVRADGSSSVEELARGLAEEFDVAEAQALDDAREFLERLRSHGLLDT